VGRVPGGLRRGGEVRRLRFEAEVLDFTPEGWVAKQIQITNDPFSPPELVLKAEQARLTKISTYRDELVATRPRLVFDQRVSIPLLVRRTVLDQREQPPGLVQFGIDADERGGLFVERAFDIVRSPALTFTITPQIYLQRMIIDTRNPADLDNYGGKAKLRYQITPTTSLVSSLRLTTLEPEEFADNLRASARINQLIRIPPISGFHTLAFEYSYRDRLFNGSLGFQTVRSSLGVVLFSPNIPLGQSGVILNYQAGYQQINSDTDRADLLEPVRDDNRITLGRFQSSVGLSRSFQLWRGQPLPATRDAGLNYTPVPIVPYLSLDLGLRGVYSNYSNGDSQENLTMSVGVSGQFGHFSRPFLDYTGITVRYTQVVDGGLSPFLFDRIVDRQILSLVFFQQLYGPLRAGVSTSYNLETRESFSTDYFLEYSRRTYGVVLRYNPILAIGSISLRISDFNWDGSTEPFDVTPVESGVTRTRF
jgi:Protein of unknown function (DUF3769)